jgi:hypothetical protein
MTENAISVAQHERDAGPGFLLLVILAFVEIGWLAGIGAVLYLLLA